MADQKITVEISAIDKTKTAFDSLKNAITGLSAQSLGMGLTIGGAFAAVAALVKKTADYGEEMLRLSQTTGITIQRLGALKYASSLAETSFEDTTIALKKLSVAMSSGNDGLKALGITAKNSKGQLRDPYEVLVEISQKFAGIKDGAGKTALAVEIFGRSGNNIIPLLNQFKNLQTEAEKAGNKLSVEAAEAADKFNDNIVLLKKNVESLGRSIGNVLIPMLNNLFPERLNDNELRLKQLAMIDVQLRNSIALTRQEIESLTLARAAILKEMDDEAATTTQPKKTAAPNIMSQAEKDKLAATQKQINAYIMNDTAEGLDEWDKKLIAIKEGFFKIYEAAKEAKLPVDGLVGAFLRNKQILESDKNQKESEKQWEDRQKAAEEGIKLYNDEQKAIEKTTAAIWEKAEATAKTNDQNRANMQKLLDDIQTKYGTAFDGINKGLSDYLASMRTTFQTGEEIAKKTAQGMENSFSTFFFDVMQGKMKSLSQYFLMFLSGIQQALANAMGQKIAGAVISSIGSMYSYNAAGGSAYAAEGAAWDLAYANGGIAPGGFTPMFKAFAKGGIADRPMLGLVGEGRYNEAIVPLPDGRSIPVQMQGGGAVINNYYTINTTDPKSFRDYLAASGAVEYVIAKDTKTDGAITNSLRKAM